jgi:hypothetical protein
LSLSQNDSFLHFDFSRLVKALCAFVGKILISQIILFSLRLKIIIQHFLETQFPTFWLTQSVFFLRSCYSHATRKPIVLRPQTCNLKPATPNLTPQT